MSKSKEELMEERFVQQDTSTSKETLDERKAKMLKLIEDSEKEFIERAKRLEMKSEDLYRMYTL